MSKELKQFFIDLQAWVDAGFPEHSIFETDAGICLNLENYDIYLVYDLEEIFDFKDYPFNDNKRVSFDNECDTDTLWQNSKRLAFVKEMSCR